MEEFLTTSAYASLAIFCVLYTVVGGVRAFVVEARLERVEAELKAALSAKETAEALAAVLLRGDGGRPATRDDAGASPAPAVGRFG